MRRVQVCGVARPQHARQVKWGRVCAQMRLLMLPARRPARSFARQQANAPLMMPETDTDTRRQDCAARLLRPRFARISTFSRRVDAPQKIEKVQRKRWQRRILPQLPAPAAASSAAYGSATRRKNGAGKRAASPTVCRFAVVTSETEPQTLLPYCLDQTHILAILMDIEGAGNMRYAPFLRRRCRRHVFTAMFAASGMLCRYTAMRL